jgi:hypothetical protein
MKFTRKMLATSMITAAGAAGVALGLRATAAADPAAAAPGPSIPGLPFFQQLVSNPAAATQLIQGLTSVLGGMQAAAPATPATPAPAATASITLPQPAVPAAAPAAASFPGDLAGLMPAGLLAAAKPAAVAAAAPAAVAPAAVAPAALPSAGLAPLLMPLSALP